MTDAATFTEITYEVLGPIARISHNRPQARNAQNRALLDQLDAALGVATADPEIRVIIIAGKGSHFSAGHDLKEAQQKRSRLSAEERFNQEEAKYLGYCLRIWDCPKPTIAQVQGACITGGFMVANMCDLIVASEDAFFSDPVCLSVACAGAEVMVHPYVMGVRKAKEMLFTGGRIGAEEALRIGMVNRVVPVADLEAETMNLAGQIAKASPFAIKLTKRSLNRTLDLAGFRASLNAHFDTHQISHHTDEFARVIEAGLAKAIETGKVVT